MATTGTADTAGAGPSGQVHIWFVGHSRDLLANLVFFFAIIGLVLCQKPPRSTRVKPPQDFYPFLFG